jgi:hypothetical protein
MSPDLFQKFEERASRSYGTTKFLIDAYMRGVEDVLRLIPEDKTEIVDHIKRILLTES